MKLRTLTIYDEDGQDIGPCLQFWNEEKKEWEYVPHTRCRFDNDTEIDKPGLNCL